MAYNSSRMETFQPGDILFSRNIGQLSPIQRLFVNLQASISGCEQGHKTTIHMAIVTSVDKDNKPMVAHIDEPDDPANLPASYQRRHHQPLGIPQQMPLVEGYENGNLLVIRHKSQEVRQALAEAAVQNVEIQQAQGTAWQLSGALRTYTNAAFGSRWDSGAQQYSEQHMICTQFVTDSIRRAEQSLGLVQGELLTVSTQAAMPKVMENDFKTRHADEYEFLISPEKNEAEFLKGVKEKLNGLVSGDADMQLIFEKVYDYLDDFMLTETQPFDSGRVLCFFADNLLEPEQYKSLQRYVKAEWGIFDEDIRNIKLSKNSEYFEKAIQGIRAHFDDKPSVERAVNRWDCMQRSLDNPMNAELHRTINDLDTVLRLVHMQIHKKAMKGGGKERRSQKLTALRTFHMQFKDIHDEMHSRTAEQRQAYFSEKSGDIRALSQMIADLPSSGITKKELTSALTKLTDIQTAVANDAVFDDRAVCGKSK